MMRSLLFAAVALSAAAPLSAQRFGPEPDAATKAQLLTLREAAWRTFFSNDQAGFQRVVPAELLAMGWDGGSWDDRAQTMANMAAFAKSGQKLTTLEFPRTEFQRYGDVVILYTTFRIVLQRTDGTSTETTGRGTEVFVRRGGQWAHTAWHLDRIGS
jgi:Domain of unknown function (DUF4440)